MMQFSLRKSSGRPNNIHGRATDCLPRI